jgi:4-amino-4-deoxy-L-arabinose transferase-like glycosyltransferase
MPPAHSRAALAACSLFILLAALVIPYAGIQADEALFSTPLFPYVSNGLRLPILPDHVPLMVMTYIGSLKTLLFWPIFRIFGTGPWTLRLPVALFGAVTIFFFFHLTRLAGGLRAAVIGAFLLATDPVFLLTNTFDWGPVALEHVFLVTGCWFLYRFGSKVAPEDGPNARIWDLAAGFLCWGLALWNKAIFVWALSGIIAGGVLVFGPEIRRWLKPRVVLVAAAAFLCGALPLVIYNLSHANATLTENAHLDPRSVPGKWIQVELAANGTSLFGYMTGEEWWPNPQAPHSARGRSAAWIRNHLGQHRSTGFYYVFGALLLAAPWWWKYRAARFSLVFMAVAWILMALTHDAGTSAHHVILLWPFPILFVSVALASLPWRPVAWAAAAVMIAMNLLVLNQYLYQFERDGAGDVFTDALYPLSVTLDSYADRTLYVVDWGIYENLNLLHEGRLNFHIAIEPLSADTPGPDQLGEIRDMFGDPGGLILNHVHEHEVFPDRAARLDRAARTLGYRREVVRTIPDSNGRPMFEIVQFVRKSLRAPE